MKIVAINGSDNGSTGNLASEILKYEAEKGNEVVLICPNPKRTDLKTYDCRFSKIDKFLSKYFVKLFGNDGFSNNFNTFKIIKFLKRFKPDIVHLHVLHGEFVNVNRLLLFLKKSKIKIIWTFHDCWAFTGKCPHFTFNSCYKWKDECKKCPHTREYPKSFLFDKTKSQFKKKKKWFENFDALTIVSVSNWLDSFLSKSICKNVKHVVIHNGVDFNNMNSNSVTKKYDFISVAYPWSTKKGLREINELAMVIDNLHLDLKICVVGLENKNKTHNSIIRYGKVDRETLKDLYNESKVLLNLSFEETFGLTVIEANSMSVPVICIKNSGGLEEIITKESGIIIETRNPEKIIGAYDYINSRYKDFCLSAFLQSRKYSLEKMNDLYDCLYYQKME